MCPVSPVPIGHRFRATGELLETIGNGMPGFQKETVAFEQAQFNWIYDLRLGPDGNIYVLDSKNYAVRMLNTHTRCVTTIAGTGCSGSALYSDDLQSATFGSNPATTFDGPWSMVLDESGNIYIGDTWNKAIRMIDSSRRSISTICGPEHDVDLDHICSLDYFGSRLYIPLWDSKLVVLKREPTSTD